MQILVHIPGRKVHFTPRGTGQRKTNRVRLMRGVAMTASPPLDPRLVAAIEALTPAERQALVAQHLSPARLQELRRDYRDRLLRRFAAEHCNPMIRPSVASQVAKALDRFAGLPASARARPDPRHQLLAAIFEANAGRVFHIKQVRRILAGSRG